MPSDFIKKVTFKNARLFALIAILSTLAFKTNFISIEYIPEDEVSNAVNSKQTKPVVIDYIKQVNSTINDHEANQVVESSIKWGEKFGINPSLLLAIAKVESTYDKYAISPMGAFGLLQVLPKWHVEKIILAKKEVGSPELFNIDTNIYIGARIIKDCKAKHNGNMNKALKCYNGSMGATNYDVKVIQTQREINKYRIATI